MGLFNRLFGTKPDASTHDVQPLQKRRSEPTDWRSSEIHLMLLSKFIEARLTDRLRGDWATALGEPLDKTIRQLIKDGLLVEASLFATVEFCNTVPDLKNLLKERGLKVSGKKQELAERLIEADEEGMAKLHAAKTVVRCSPNVLPRLTEYAAEKKREYDQMVTDALSTLRRKDFAAASRLIGVYESKQVELHTENPLALKAPPRSTETDVDALKKIFSLRPNILKDLSPDDWSALHVAYSLSHLLHGRFSDEWLPDGFVGVSKFQTGVTHRMFDAHFRHVQTLDRIRSLGIKQGKILCTSANQGTCDECMKLNGKEFSLADVPQLPYERCTCQRGCGCIFQPEFTFDD